MWTYEKKLSHLCYTQKPAVQREISCFVPPVFYVLFACIAVKLPENYPRSHTRSHTSQLASYRSTPYAL